MPVVSNEIMTDVRNYYAITTKIFLLRTSHDEWLRATQELYNKVLYFYYRLFLDHPELHGLGDQKLLREMERLSIVGRDGRPVERPLPFEKFPLYFRRAAINAALAAGKSYLAREDQERPTEAFASGVTLYKGNYKDLDSHSIRLKVWDGERWRWIHARLSGNDIPEGAVCLSPRLVFRDGSVQLHVPIRQSVPDGKPLKERMGEDMKLCSVQFTNGDAIAVCCVVDSRGTVTAVRFLRGGRDYTHRCRRLLEKIEASRKAVGGKRGRDDNKRYWKKLKQISDDMAHRVSRQAVDFCVENDVGVIVLPKYSQEFTRYVMAAVGNWSPLRLNYQVRTQLKYKAWQAGILVLESEVSDIERYCALCGGAVCRHGEQFVCENGHQGNRRVNAAWNLGKKTWKSLSKHVS